MLEKFEKANDDIKDLVDSLRKETEYVRTKVILGIANRTTPLLPSTENVDSDASGPARQVSGTTAMTRHQLRIISNVPRPKNEDYTGREVQLQQLYEHLNQKQETSSLTDTQLQVSSSCIIHGMAGVGKTELAIEYLNRYGGEYNWILWFSAEDKLKLQQSVSVAAEEFRSKMRVQSGSRTTPEEISGGGVGHSHERDMQFVKTLLEMEVGMYYKNPLHNLVVLHVASMSQLR